MEDIEDKLYNAGLIQREPDYEAIEDLCQKIGISYSETGNSLASRTSFAFLVPGDNLKEINNNVSDFLSKFAKFEIHLTNEDLKVI